MTTDTDTDQVLEALDGARQAWDLWQQAWHDLLGAMEVAGLSTARIDAYRVGTGRDEGGGQSLTGWLDEIEEQVDASVSTEQGDPS